MFVASVVTYAIFAAAKVLGVTTILEVDVIPESPCAILNSVVELFPACVDVP
jgi:hypothetical protein